MTRAGSAAGRWPRDTGVVCGLLVALLVLGSGRWLPAQEIEGTVVGADSTPVPGTLVELHRITETSGSIVDSALSDASGRFRFALEAEEQAGAVFLPTARHDGILYWGTPVHGRGVEGDPEVQLLTVFDTMVVTGPLPDQPVSLRHVVLTPLASGLQVEEVIDLPGRGDRTLVAEEAGGPLWASALAADGHGLLPAQGGVPPEDLDLSDGRVEYTGVLPPSGVRIAVSYFVPTSRYSLDVGHATRRLDVLVVDVAGLDVEGTGLSEAAPAPELGMAVHRFTGTDLEPRTSVSIRAEIGEGGRVAAWIWFSLALVLAVGALVAARPGSRAGPPGR